MRRIARSGGADTTEPLEGEASLLLLGRSAARQEAGDAIVILPAIVNFTRSTARTSGSPTALFIPLVSGARIPGWRGSTLRLTLGIGRALGFVCGLIAAPKGAEASELEAIQHGVAVIMGAL